MLTAEFSLKELLLERNRLHLEFYCCFYIRIIANNKYIGNEVTLKSGETPVLISGVPLDWAEVCEYLEREWTGSEGPIEDKEVRLRGISVAFRHGER